MIILGVDPGLARTGYGIIKVLHRGRAKKSYQVIDYGCLITPLELSTHFRLKKIYHDFKKIVKKYQPDLCIVEELFFAQNAKTAMKVGEARGIILLTLAEKNIPLLSLTPLQVKMGLTSYGRASKKQIQKIVKLLLSLKKNPQPDDAADALALAICGARLIKNMKLYGNIKK
ncbi:MAG: crossover junction endodeoxyribonuclease RuvC [Patescibacteria group bacterium]|nr:crossover junction endodeoxyribonuclease RuvC [Patescibacteria group bacterium]